MPPNRRSNFLVADKPNWVDWSEPGRIMLYYADLYVGQKVMGSSFIKYRDHGFWSHDTFVEDLAREVATVIDGLPKAEAWLAELGAHWRLQASGDFSGWIHLKLDDFLVSEERRKSLRNIVRSVAGRHAAEDPIHQTGVFVVRLLDGELATDATSPLDYMVGRRPPGNKTQNSERKQAADKSKQVDWSGPGRIKPAKPGWREGTRHWGFGFSQQQASNDEVTLSE